MSTHCNLQISRYDASMKAKWLMRSLKDLADSTPTLSGPYTLHHAPRTSNELGQLYITI